MQKPKPIKGRGATSNAASRFVNESPDVPFDRSINPYKGCEHGCVYCFARPTHAYLDLSPGLDFETKIFAKPNAAELLAKELAALRYRAAPIALSVNTDAYQPIERKLGITRNSAEKTPANDTRPAPGGHFRRGFIRTGNPGAER